MIIGLPLVSVIMLSSNACVKLVSAHPLSHSQKLYRDLFTNYSRSIRPVRNDSTTLHVRMQLWFMQILKVDEIDQILTVYCWIEEYWRDEFLTWDPSDYGDINTLRIPANEIWRPDILVYNNADMNVDENEVSTNVVLNSTGDLVCFRATIFKITCSLDMTYFPFDMQNCTMMFASWTYDGSKVFISIPDNSQSNEEYYIENTEWKLLNFSIEQNIKTYSCCPEPFVDLTYRFILERNPSYYTLNLIIPSILITIVTMVGFFTPYSSTGENTEKVSLGVTALLSLAIILLMVADKMPATSKVIPLIGKYYMGLIFWIFLAAIVTTGTLRIQSKGNVGKPVSLFWKRVFFDYVAKLLFMEVDIISAEKARKQRLANRRRATALTNSIATKLNGGIAETSLLISNPSNCSHSLPDQSPKVWVPKVIASDLPTGASSLATNSFAYEQFSSQAQPETFSRQHIEPELLSVLLHFRSTVQLIHLRLEEDEYQHMINKEWEQLARVCDRLLMYIFIIGCISFALFMLHSPVTSATLSVIP